MLVKMTLYHEVRYAEGTSSTIAPLMQTYSCPSSAAVNYHLCHLVGPADQSTARAPMWLHYRKRGKESGCGNNSSRRQVGTTALAPEMLRGVGSA